MTGQSVCYNFPMLKYLVILLVTFVFSCSGEDTKKELSKNKERIIEVEVVDVKKEMADIIYQAIGDIEAEKDVVLISRLGGQISKVYVSEGDKVNEGDLLIKLDDREIKASIEKAIAELKVIEANYENTLSMYKRRKPLLEKNMVSEEEIEKLEASLNVYKAQIESIKANLRALEVQKSYTEIVAPFSGKVADLYVEEGQTVMPQQKICRIISNEDIFVVFKIPQKYINKISLNQKVYVSVEGIGDFEAKVSYISPYVDKSKMAIVKAKIIKKGSGLRHGMFANVRVAVGKDEAFVVPERAVVFSGNTSFVWVLAEEYPRKVIVNIISKEREKLYVKGELREGDKVIVSNVHRLKEGVKVIAR